ncbi:ras-domain-containing protein [Phanerochaete sordida]|uniref:Ras-domain-containing protein n=1 Tax=Phanerochaete sordida TaxID=48140 RepID=A0A9P3GEV1_9APHY|nr:ras-domain-containing protein [Phanerochaete sordida]
MVETNAPARERTRPAEEQANTVQCINVAVIGDRSTGKSCLSLRFTEGDGMDPEILKATTATIGIGTLTKDLVLDGKKINVLLWDTAGQERFRSLTRSYYRRADAIMLVYDITNRASFDALPSWYRELQDHAGEHVALAVVGTKVDQEEARQVQYQEGHRFAQMHDSLFFETSAISGQGVAEPFVELIQRALAAKRAAYPPRGRGARAPPRVRLSNPPPAPMIKAVPGCQC